MRVLLVLDRDADIGETILLGLQQGGCQTTCLDRFEWERWSVDVQAFDVVMSYGPHNGSMMPTLHLVEHLSPSARPLLVWWMNENMPDWRLPAWWVSAAATFRQILDTAYHRLPWFRALLRRIGMEDVWWTGQRLRLYAELRWARRKGLLDVLAVTSKRRSEHLTALKFQPIHVPLGYGPALGRDLGGTRDLDAVWIGKATSGRRRRILDEIDASLARHGVQMTRFDNLHDWDERTAVMNRTKILVNVLQHREDFTGHRFLLGAANKALVVSESFEDSVPFENGRHLVAVPASKLGQTIAFYATHPEDRELITEEAHCLVTEQLTIARSVGRILEECRRVLAARGAGGSAGATLVNSEAAR